ncbi:MAG: PfkB family carbohydrate kinase [Haloquadratum sp.]
MVYDRLRRRLADETPSPSLATLPDGSIDKYCTLSAGKVGPIDSRETFGREVADAARSSFRMDVESVEPGGQAVNVARQLHALDGDVTCYGHLDASVFDVLPFETVSMGEPAVVYAFNFADSDVMFVEGSEVADWTLDDLRAVADLDDVFGVDAVCCSNWVSIPEMGTAFRRLADADLPRIPFVFDPGDIVGSDPDDVESLRTALSALQETFDVVYNGNRQEIRATAATLSDPPATDRGRVDAIRAATGVEAVVLHARTEAIAATADGSHRVENLRTATPERYTGGGDRFTGGLGYGLASGWDWELSLACGNAAATYYVDVGETGTVDDLREYLY